MYQYILVIKIKDHLYIHLWKQKKNGQLEKYMIDYHKYIQKNMVLNIYIWYQLNKNIGLNKKWIEYHNGNQVKKHKQQHGKD